MCFQEVSAISFLFHWCVIRGACMGRRFIWVRSCDLEVHWDELLHQPVPFHVR